MNIGGAQFAPSQITIETGSTGNGLQQCRGPSQTSGQRLCWPIGSGLVLPRHQWLTNPEGAYPLWLFYKAGVGVLPPRLTLPFSSRGPAVLPQQCPAGVAVPQRHCAACPPVAMPSCGSPFLRGWRLGCEELPSGEHLQLHRQPRYCAETGSGKPRLKPSSLAAKLTRWFGSQSGSFCCEDKEGGNIAIHFLALLRRKGSGQTFPCSPAVPQWLVGRGIPHPLHQLMGHTFYSQWTPWPR